LDLRLLFSVVSRFWQLIACGFVLALLLAVLSYVRVDPFHSPHFEYRKAEVWRSETSLLLTRGTTSTIPQVTDVGELASLTSLYAQIAASDVVRRMALEGTTLRGKITAVAASQPYGTPPLPVVTLSGLSSSPSAAKAMAARGTRALRRYVEAQFDAQGTPRTSRIAFRALTLPSKPEVLQARRKTLPMIVFIATMVLVVGLALVLENLRPRVRPVVLADVDAQPAQGARMQERHTA
jgi:hypothetical protein